MSGNARYLTQKNEKMQNNPYTLAYMGFFLYLCALK